VEADIETQEIKMTCEKLSFAARIWFEIAQLSTEYYQSLRNKACATINQIKALACQLNVNDRVMVEGNRDEMMCT